MLVPTILFTKDVLCGVPDLAGLLIQWKVSPTIGITGAILYPVQCAEKILGGIAPSTRRDTANIVPKIGVMGHASIAELMVRENK